MKRSCIFLFFLSSVLLPACKDPVVPKAVVMVSKPEKVNEEVTRLLQQKIKGIDTSEYLISCGDTLFATRQLSEFYNRKQFSVTWSDKGKLTKQGDILLSVLRNADIYGLIRDDYHFLKLDSLVRTSHDLVKRKYDAMKLSEADILFTDAFFKFIVHVSKGRFNSDSLTLEWHPEKLDTNLVSILDYALANNAVRKCINSLEPKNDQYRKLKLALKNYKTEFKGIMLVYKFTK